MLCRSLLFLFAFYVTCIDGRYFRNDYTYDAAVEGWVKLHLMPETWEEARLRCFLEGSVLATPIDNQMLDVMKKTMGQKLKTVFTGMSAIYSKGDFYSVEGVSLGSIAKSWAPGEPNNPGDENCITMHVNGSLADFSCEKPLPFICYKKNSENIPATNQCGTVDPDYIFERQTGHCYKFHRFGQSWSKAFKTCSAEGGHLAIINSDVEAQSLVELMAKYPEQKVTAKYKDVIGIGFHAWSQDGVFMTINGQTLEEAGYEKWSAGQPDNWKTGEKCGSVFRNALLNDIWCENSIPFICEKLPQSLLDNQAGSRK